MNTSLDTEDLETRARRRVGRKIGLGVHALVFVLVNLGLYAISALNGDAHWARLPLLGWGLGLSIHALVTLISLRGDGWRQRLVQREIEQLRRRRD